MCVYLLRFGRLGALCGAIACTAESERKAVVLQVAAGKVLSEACGVVGNRDIEPFIPVLVSSIARPAEVPDCVHKLSATTFVQVRPVQF